MLANRPSVSSLSKSSHNTCFARSAKNSNFACISALLYPVHYNYERNLYSVLQVLHLFLQQDLFMKCYFGSAKVKIGFMSVANDVAILM